MAKKNNLVNFKPTTPTKQAQIEIIAKQLAPFRDNLRTLTPIFPIKMRKLPEETNFLVETDDACCFLHSQFNRTREMERMFSEVDPEIETLIIFGIGCGYALEHAARNYRHLKTVTIIEPSTELLYRVLGLQEVIERVAMVPTVNFICNQSAQDTGAQLGNDIAPQLKKKFAMVYHTPYRTLFKNYYEQFQERFLAVIRQTQVNISTVDHNIYLKTQNIINNLNQPGIDVNQLLTRIKGIPAIMVSAGPSLNKNIHLIEEAKKKALVVAVGSAIKILHNNGIVPHMRAAFSPYPDENTVFDGIDDYQGVPLLFANTLDYLVVSNYDAPKGRMVMTGDSMSRYFYEYCGLPYTIVNGGGTIANITFDLLCRAACAPVILTGQDMCMTNDSLYASGSWSDPKISAGATQGLIKEKNVYGEDVWTSKAFLGIRADFETMIAMYPDVRIVNATEGGLPLAGSENQPLAQVLEQLPEQPISEIIAELFTPEAMNLGDVSPVMRQTLLEMEEVLKLNNQRIEDLKRILSTDGKLIDIVNALRDLEKYNESLLAIPLYRIVIEPELGGLFYAIKTANHYTGADLEKQAESLSRSLIGFSTRLAEYGQFVYQQLQFKAAEMGI